MYERVYLQQLATRLKEPKRFIQVLMGPRQVGKTTLIGQLITQLDVDYIFESADAVAASDIVWINALWDKARTKIKTENLEEYLLIIDEIQKIDNWSEIVKKLWDEDVKNNIKIKVVLLGSSRLLLQQGLTESLAGRFESTYIGHWSYSEMKAAFDFTP
jgi:predicted AAA+ superfamily ATPase